MKPHRGILILVLGILGMVVCLPCGIAAWIMGSRDLKEMNAGKMDPGGRGQTYAGRVLGMIATILAIVAFVVMIAVALFVFFLQVHVRPVERSKPMVKPRASSGAAVARPMATDQAAGQLGPANVMANGKRSHGPEQATGAPDTLEDRDMSTAWASLEADAGEEWLELDYNPQMCATMVRIHETYNPGAVTGIILKNAIGGEIIKITAKDTTKNAPAFFEITFPLTIESVKTVRVLLDTSKVPGWNEIDAVELVGPESRSWAVSARASSTFADHSPGPGAQ
ncbi:MAG: DUF4190 domain-containing protein [Candidatus Sumerlaeota bacterium]|nr:DUF4190 domain-containing protein [Candidatus Sumerlaeota bacterium]